MSITKRSKWLITIAAILVPATLLFVGFLAGSDNENNQSRKERYIQFENKKFSIKWAETPKEQIRGLSGTKSLEVDSGLMFEFPVEDLHGIWMKDMNYSIDIIWLDEKLRVVHIEDSVSPETYPKIFKPSEPAKYVLEINAGSAKKHEIKLKDLAKVF